MMEILLIRIIPQHSAASGHCACCSLSLGHPSPRCPCGSGPYCIQVIQVAAPISPSSESILYNSACPYPVTVPSFPVYVFSPMVLTSIQINIVLYLLVSLS